MVEFDDMSYKTLQRAIKKKFGVDLPKEEEQETYSIGDRFKNGSAKYILVSPTQNSATFINLENGNMWSSSKRVIDRYKISEAEFEEITGNDDDFKQI